MRIYAYMLVYAYICVYMRIMRIYVYIWVYGLVWSVFWACLVSKIACIGCNPHFGSEILQIAF